MSDIDPKSTVQRAKQRMDSYMQNFQWEGMKPKEFSEYCELIKRNHAIYYKIRNPYDF